MKIILFIMAILIVVQSDVYSQITFVDDVIDGDNSEIILIRFELNQLAADLEITFDIEIENPTVCYIVGIEQNINVTSSQIETKDNGVFSVKLLANSSLSLFSFRAKLLSGFDSTTNVTIKNVRVNNSEMPDDNALVKNNFFDKSGTYIRFLDSEDPYPNPLWSGQNTYIRFHNDLPTSIRFIVCNVKGHVLTDEYQFYESGTNEYEISTAEYAAGAYFISIYSEIGNTTEQIVVFK